MDRFRELTEQTLARYLEGHGALSEAKCYALEGGRRVRGALTLAWCEYAGGRAEDAVPYALAVELIHAMSLIHDDLPCMDDAETRRGKPSLHKSFGEGVAVLTGDALLADAFTLVTHAKLSSDVNELSVYTLARAASRMAEGQASELMGDRNWQRIARGKTAALFEAACELGTLAADARPRANGALYDRERARCYGRALGLAYQLADDIRDGDGAANASESPRDSLCELLEGCRVYQGGEAGKWLRGLPKAISGDLL